MSYAAYMPDGELLTRATAGDGEALASLVDRHASRLYDLAFRLTGDTARATESTVGAFAGLANGSLALATGVPATALDAAVAAVALASATVSLPRPARRDAGRRREGGRATSPVGDSGAEAALGMLPPRDRAILELSDRCGLADTIVAPLVGLPVDELSSARAAAESAFTAALMLARARADCAVLRTAAGAIGAADAGAAAVLAHASSCPICAATLEGLPEPAEMLRALPAVPLTPEGADDILWRVLRLVPEPHDLHQAPPARVSPRPDSTVPLQTAPHHPGQRGQRAPGTGPAAAAQADSLSLDATRPPVPRRPWEGSGSRWRATMQAFELARRGRGRGRRLDRYVQRRSPLRVLLPLAVLAVLVAAGTARFVASQPRDQDLTAAAATVTAGYTPPPRLRAARAEPTATPPGTAIVAAPPPEASPPQDAKAMPEPSPTAVATAVPPTAVVAALSPTTPPTSVPLDPPAATIPALPSSPAAPALLRPLSPTAVPPDPAPKPTEVTLAALPPPGPTAPSPPAPPAATPAATPTATTRAASATPTRRTTARLALDTQSLSLGVEVGPRGLQFRNPGGDPLEWRVIADSTWLEVTPQVGTLAPGAAAQVAVSISRGALPTGSYTGNLEVLTDGGDGLVPVTMIISPSNTTVSAFTEPLVPINTAGCAEPTTHPVSADISSAAPPVRAVVYYSLNGGTESSKSLAATGRRYSTTIGPFAEPGNMTYSLVITEADGNIVRSAAYTVAVRDCPSRVRTLPVSLPSSQSFTLGKGGHHVYTFSLAQPGNIVVQARWEGSAPRLSTLLYGPRYSEQPYEQRTGTRSLSFAFPVTEADVAAGGLWALHLVNYDDGDAAGTLILTFEPRRQAVPTTTAVPSAPAAPSRPPVTAPPPTRTPMKRPTAATPSSPRPSASPTK